VAKRSEPTTKGGRRPKDFAPGAGPFGDKGAALPPAPAQPAEGEAAEKADGARSALTLAATAARKPSFWAAVISLAENRFD
jgi:hypothetical protein